MFKKKLKQSRESAESGRSADHQRLVALVNSMNDAVIAFDPEGTIGVTNSAALNLFDSNSLTGKKISEIMRLIDQKGKEIDPTKLLRKKSTFNSRDLRLIYSDGSDLSLEISVSPVRLGFGFSAGGFVMLARDITQAKSIDQEREEFVSVASHELRTPIAITEGNISNALALAEKSGTSEAIKQSLESAHEQVVFLSSLINDLSMLSRAERGIENNNASKIVVKELLEKLVSSNEDKAHQKKLSLKYSLSDPSLSIKSNELYLREIMQNFLTNAIKYTQKGGIEVSASETPSYVKLSVLDSGIGISTAEQRKLFIKFFRSDDPRVQKFIGSGLGLYICSKLAKILKGRLEVSSHLDKGSSFSVLLPKSTLK